MSDPLRAWRYRGRIDTADRYLLGALVPTRVAARAHCWLRLRRHTWGEWRYGATVTDVDVRDCASCGAHHIRWSEGGGVF